MKLALILFLVPMAAFSMDRICALSLIESANNDRAVGRAGEISRYQVRKNEWRSVTPSTNYRDPSLARQVTLVLVERRVQRFEQIYRRPPTDFEFYALWNAPSQVYNRRISRTVAERARRFANLCQVEVGNQASVQKPIPLAQPMS
jgi:hypothetical protein